MNVVAQQAQAELARFRFKAEPSLQEAKQKSPRGGALVFADDKTRPWRVIGGFNVPRHIRFIKFGQA